MSALDAPQPVLDRMQAIIEQWEACADRRMFFLTCYRMMTANMLAAIDRQEFDDSRWVNELLHHFAEYYFVSLEAYERDPDSPCQVWQLAHNLARSQGSVALQHLLVGVNAHINYDLVLTVAEILRPDWDGLNESQRASRYQDFCRVNEMIARTIDAVQDEVLEPAMPVMDWMDRLLGPVDEILISHLITSWRENVWRNALRLLDAREHNEQLSVVQQVEQEAMRIGEMIAFRSPGDRLPRISW